MKLPKYKKTQFFSATFYGQMINIDHHRSDTAAVFPAHTATAVMQVQNPGRWMFSCQVADHLSGGMFTFYDAESCRKDLTTSKPTSAGKVRKYYIAAEEGEWDYGPSGKNGYDGGDLKTGR